MLQRIKKLWEDIKRFIKDTYKGTTVDGLASLSMRLARPIFFILTTVMLVYGWFNPPAMMAYFTAMAAAPEWLTNIITILVLGLAGEKGIRAIGDMLAKKAGAA